jgi:hypothetical protein
MARLVWTDRGVRYFDPNPVDVAEATIASGMVRSAARLIIRAKSGQGGQTIEEEVRVVKEKGKPALIGRVRRDAGSATNRSAQP